ncbi:MAG: hypothetical protein AAF487_05225 [Bacteroidota bacterium]
MDWDDLKIPFLISAIVVFLVSLYSYILRQWKNRARVGSFPFLHSLPSKKVNEIVRFKFELPYPEDVRFSILDQDEQLVQSLIDERKREGIYEVEFDSSSLHPGDYFYSLETASHKNIKRFEKI